MNIEKFYRVAFFPLRALAVHVGVCAVLFFNYREAWKEGLFKSYIEVYKYIWGEL